MGLKKLHKPGAYAFFVQKVGWPELKRVANVAGNPPPSLAESFALCSTHWESLSEETKGEWRRLAGVAGESPEFKAKAAAARERGLQAPLPKLERDCQDGPACADATCRLRHDRSHKSEYGEDDAKAWSGRRKRDRAKLRTFFEWNVFSENADMRRAWLLQKDWWLLSGVSAETAEGSRIPVEFSLVRFSLARGQDHPFTQHFILGTPRLFNEEEVSKGAEGRWAGELQTAPYRRLVQSVESATQQAPHILVPVDAYNDTVGALHAICAHLGRSPASLRADRFVTQLDWARVLRKFLVGVSVPRQCLGVELGRATWAGLAARAGVACAVHSAPGGGGGACSLGIAQTSVFGIINVLKDALRLPPGLAPPTPHPELRKEQIANFRAANKQKQQRKVPDP